MLPVGTVCLHELEPLNGWDIEALINSRALSVSVADIVLSSMSICHLCLKCWFQGGARAIVTVVLPISASRRVRVQ